MLAKVRLRSTNYGPKSANFVPNTTGSKLLLGKIDRDRYELGRLRANFRPTCSILGGLVSWGAENGDGSGGVNSCCNRGAAVDQGLLAPSCAAPNGCEKRSRSASSAQRDSRRATSARTGPRTDEHTNNGTCAMHAQAAATPSPSNSSTESTSTRSLCRRRRTTAHLRTLHGDDRAHNLGSKCLRSTRSCLVRPPSELDPVFQPELTPLP